MCEYQIFIGSAQTLPLYIQSLILPKSYPSRVKSYYFFAFTIIELLIFLMNKEQIELQNLDIKELFVMFVVLNGLMVYVTSMLFVGVFFILKQF